jgi:hypothetical protein
MLNSKAFFNLIRLLLLCKLFDERKNLSSIPQKKNNNMKALCHHVKHTLFYLWLKYETI